MILFFVSCQIQGSMQSLIGYQSKVTRESPELFNYDSQFDCDNHFGNHKVVITNGSNLLRCIKEQDLALIYIWQPNCVSSKCIDPRLVQSICNEKGISLFVVAEYYDTEKMSIQYDLEKSIYAIDCNYYKTNFTEKYLTEFLSDLSPEKRIPRKSFIYFNNGIFQNSSDSLSK